jgi:site-specific DNA-methyltransferase (adenine-specific)/adenine-specific DNA-methyltransferase
MNVATDSLYWYSKNVDTRFRPFMKEAGDSSKSYWHTFWKPTDRPTLRYNIFGITPTRGQWLWKRERTKIAIKNYQEFLKQKKLTLEEYWIKTGKTKEFVKKEKHLDSYNSVKYWIPPRDFVLANTNWTDIQGYSRTTGYPTENSEDLLSRLISTCTNKGDLVMDVFVGSGTTLAVAEKLNRRWIGCDIGKLAIYTTQKRLLEIDKSKDLENPKKKYGKPAKSFAVVTSGLYDLGKIFALKKDEYIRFVKDLFEIEETKQKKIGGVEIDGKKREFYAKIFPYWEFKNVSVDEKYLRELHKSIGKKIDGRFYIIAPSNNVDFISDYHQIDNVRYYFLKVPYQIIKELHKVQFKKLRQPQSKKQINDLDEAIGFHFIRQPEVKSEIKTLKDKVVLKIKKFESAYSQNETGEKLKNFESLAMLLVDLNYDGEKFMMTKYFFAQDLLNGKKSDKEESEEEIKEQLTKQKEIIKEFPKDECGKQIMVIYVDIYGNEFREKFNVK